MALKLIAQGASACRTFVTGHSFLFVDDSLAGDSRGSRIAWYHDDCRWQTADGTLLTRLDCSGPLLVLLFNGSEGTVAYPCRHCHMTDGRLYADDKPVAQLEPHRGWRTGDNGERFRTLELREQAALW